MFDLVHVPVSVLGEPIIALGVAALFVLIGANAFSAKVVGAPEVIEWLRSAKGIVAASAGRRRDKLSILSRLRQGGP